MSPREYSSRVLRLETHLVHVPRLRNLQLHFITSCPEIIHRIKSQQPLITDSKLEASWNVMAHAQKPDLIFRRNGRVHLNRRVASVQLTTVSRGVQISGSKVGYTMFRGSAKTTGYPLHSPVSPSLPRPCVNVCHHISTGVYHMSQVTSEDDPFKIAHYLCRLLWLATEVFRPSDLYRFQYLPFLIINIATSPPFAHSLKFEFTRVYILLIASQWEHC